ncbi:YgiQ family radical SAM protein [Desulfonatronum parangueonense]
MVTKSLSNTPAQPEFLPMSRSEMQDLGWRELDILLVTGDAYIDHPAFGVPLLGRWLSAHGFKVGIVAQPRWDSLEDILALGRPRLFSGVTAGALDSMLAHYTAFRRIRRDDAYSPGGRAGARPNRATIVYTNLVKRAFPGLPVVIGGIEASLRRISHYDFWTDKIRRSILLDSKADLLLSGMAERSVLALALALETALKADKSAEQPAAPLSVKTCLQIPGAVFSCREADLPRLPDALELPSHDQILSSPHTLLKATELMEQHVHQGQHALIQSVGDRLLVLTAPSAPLSEQEMDALYDLPFARRQHPSYTEPIPALEMIAASITTHRGCGGGCSFCSLALHQGRRISSRSKKSIMAEARKMTAMDHWKGVISDVGGPSANMWQATCSRESEPCQRNSCMHPAVCPFFRVDQQSILAMLSEIRGLPDVRHVRVASGVRFDLLLQDTKAAVGLIRDFVGGQLKLAPEHASENVLRLMRKPRFKVFEQFLALFEHQSARIGKKQFVVPYLMSAFPGCTDQDMAELANWLKQKGWRPQQVQCFVPTPGTLATAMFHAGKDTAGNPLFVASGDAQRQAQHKKLTSLLEPASPAKKDQTRSRARKKK